MLTIQLTRNFSNPPRDEILTNKIQQLKTFPCHLGCKQLKSVPKTLNFFLVLLIFSLIFHFWYLQIYFSLAFDNELEIKITKCISSDTKNRVYDLDGSIKLFPNEFDIFELIAKLECFPRLSPKYFLWKIHLELSPDFTEINIFLGTPHCQYYLCDFCYFS